MQASRRPAPASKAHGAVARVQGFKREDNPGNLRPGVYVNG